MRVYTNVLIMELKIWTPLNSAISVVSVLLSPNHTIPYYALMNKCLSYSKNGLRCLYIILNLYDTLARKQRDTLSVIKVTVFVR